MSFLKQILATILGIFISLFIFLFLSITIISTVVSSVEVKQSVDIAPHSILKIDLEGRIKEYEGKKFVKDVMVNFMDKNTLNDYIDAINSASVDENIDGIVMTNNSPMIGRTQIISLRNAIKKFKESGKFVYAYADFISQKDYYLKSVADSIFLNPTGMIDFGGLSSEVLYFKDFQEKTGVKMEVIRHGKYKSAVEPFLNNKMSNANRQQINSLLKSIWSSMSQDISVDRDISIATLELIANSLGARNAELALSNKMIDRAMYSDEFESLLKSKIGITKEENLNFIKLDDYASVINNKKTIERLSSTNEKIAVIYALGEIMYGKGSPETIGQESMISALRKAADDNQVKGIVLRVDSPGGDALTSDIIWHEVINAKKKKPVYVSMGSMAASGGYYISCGANRIFAEKTTITGSIGVFGILPNVKQLADKMGINAEQVSTHTHANLYSVFEPLSPETRTIIQESIERIYKTFVQRVADGRKMPFAQVDNIAQGRVWSGSEALDNGLVDEIGGLQHTLTQLAKKLDIEDYNIVNYPEYHIDIDEFLDKFIWQRNIKKFISNKIGDDNYRNIQAAARLNEIKGIQTRLPFDIYIK